MRTLLLVVAIAACSKSSSSPPAPQGTVGPDGVRRIPIEAGAKGYTPDTITAAPGEKLDLVFTRTVDSECLSQVKVGDGPLNDLPLGQPVHVAVTAPATGKLTFVCGMDMQTGTVVVAP